MTREIKFRAWDKKEKKWLDTERTHVGFDGVMFSGEGDDYGCLMNYKDTFLMQYTGLKDKKGKECYEGDLVKYSGNERIYEVSWSMGGFHSIPRDIESQLDSSGKEWRGVGHTDFEIVGNIWES